MCIWQHWLWLLKPLKFWAMNPDKIVQSKISSYRRLTRLLTEKGFPISWERCSSTMISRPRSVQKKIIFNLMAEGYTGNLEWHKLMTVTTPEYSVEQWKANSPGHYWYCTVRRNRYLAPILWREVKTKPGVFKAEYIDHRLIKGGLDNVKTLTPMTDNL